MSVRFQRLSRLAAAAVVPTLVATTLAGSAHADSLPAAWLDAMSGVRADPAPEKLTNNRHYFTSNEHKHWLWRPQLEDSGGVFVGLGTDQNYLMAGWAKPELLILIDFDGAIVELHKAYGVAFQGADTPADFLDLWTDAGVGRMRVLLEEAIPDEARRKRPWRIYKRARKGVEKRLAWTMKAARKAGVSTFLDDPKQYEVVAKLWREGRVITRRGDLTGEQTLRDLGKALASLGTTIRTLYLSNAEQYFRYGEAFRKNMLALPFDERSTVLRTTHKGRLRYVYVTQSGPNLHAWMSGSRVAHVYGMYPPKETREGKRLFAIKREPKRKR